jgi:hypothetical protein
MFLVVPPILVFAVLGLWLAQLLVIEGQKRFLHQLRHRHEPLIRFTNFVGIMFQTFCQWLGYTVTHSGVAEFHLSINDGEVTPKRKKTGFAKWVADGFLFLGPFLIPAGLLLAAGFFVIRGGFIIPAGVVSVQSQVTSFGEALIGFVQAFIVFLEHLNLLDPLQLGFIVLLFFLGLGIRPSYLGQRRRERVTVFTDLDNIAALFLGRTLYICVFVALVYAIATVSFLLQNAWFLSLVTVFAWIALLAILALVLTFVLLIFLRTLDEIQARWRYMPFLAMVVSYVGFRVLFFVVPLVNAEGASLFGMLGVTLLVTILLLRFKTNTFKASTAMKHRRDPDAKRRSSQRREG